jgi:hypothetical protein
MNISYRLKALGALGMIGALLATYAVFFYQGTRAYDHAGLPITGVDDTHGFLIKLGAAIPTFLLCWVMLALRKQLTVASAKGLG